MSRRVWCFHKEGSGALGIYIYILGKHLAPQLSFKGEMLKKLPALANISTLTAYPTLTVAPFEILAQFSSVLLYRLVYWFPTASCTQMLRVWNIYLHLP